MVSSIGDFGHDHYRLGLPAAADRERASDRPALDPNGEFHDETKYDRSPDRNSRPGRSRPGLSDTTIFERRFSHLHPRRRARRAGSNWRVDGRKFASALEKIVDAAAGGYADARKIDIDLHELND